LRNGTNPTRIRGSKMAVNKPVGDNARKGAVKKRSQVKTKLGGATAWTKRNKKGGEFMAVKKPAKKKKPLRNSKAFAGRSRLSSATLSGIRHGNVFAALRFLTARQILQVGVNSARYSCDLWSRDRAL
jgi:hypothetical protein